MTIGQMHDFINLLKNQGQGGYHSPEEIDRALNSGSSDKFGEEKQEFERTQKISGDLANFKKVASVVISAGYGPLPADYDYATGATTNAGLPIDIVPESEWPTRLNDPVAPPIATYPIMAIRDQIQVEPTLTPIKLYYLRQPVDVEYVYSDSGGDITPNPGASTNSDWPINCHVDIVLRALVYLGVPLSEDVLIKLKSFKKQTEQV